MTESRKARKQGKLAQFPGVFWLTIMFEFFERGAYYGMMSVLSVYFTDVLLFSKGSVGIIKSVIQPILYFLPIVAGALADRFGYRKALTVAFALLGSGYFLTSQFTTYTAVFVSLVVMAVGAGTFKPIISGTIARTTDQSNSTLGFGVYYWSINLGAFLFPLILVPFLKNNYGWHWVIIASAVCTGIMLVPTILVFRDPRPAEPGPEDPDKAGGTGPEDGGGRKDDKVGLVQTVANAFEIVYSPFVLIFLALKRRSPVGVGLAALAGLGLVAWGAYDFLKPRVHEIKVSRIPLRVEGRVVLVQVDRNQSAKAPFKLKKLKTGTPIGRLCEHALRRLEPLGAVKSAPAGSDGRPGYVLKIFKPEKARSRAASIARLLEKKAFVSGARPDAVARSLVDAERKLAVLFEVETGLVSPAIRVRKESARRYRVTVKSDRVDGSLTREVLRKLRQVPALAGISFSDVRTALTDASRPKFFVLFIAMVYLTSLLILSVERRVKALTAAQRGLVVTGFGAAMLAVIWLVPNLSVFARILCSVIYLTLLSLFLMEVKDERRFKDHFQFLLMVFLYSGFWVLYFQMFDSVLWYVKAYVDATPLNDAVNSLLSVLGIGAKWRFDVEHVTVINAGTIILLQLVISNIVKDTDALPTMVVGILLGTVGMAMLAISTGIWVFLAGIAVFSIGEMTAHPKFISYVGQTAPRARVAMYMGYVFLYGVIGSSIGGVLGANLYVEFVDDRNQPRTLWLIFACIGLLTILGLLLYNRFFGRKETRTASTSA